VDVAQNYGEYILRTGKGVVAQAEDVMGAFFYRTRFAGRKPIVDVGPGRCWFTRQAPADIIAVDNAPELVAHYRALGLDIRLGDAYRLPLDDGSMQGVFCCWLLEHLEEPYRAVAEFHRVLQPGGYGCIVVPTPNDMVAFYDDYTHVRPFTAASLRQLAEDAGFSGISTAHLPWCRGMNQLMRALGERAASSYMEVGDRWLRRLGLANRNNLMLEVWK
jgi:SAM-dependent methyltransferase